MPESRFELEGPVPSSEERAQARPCEALLSAALEVANMGTWVYDVASEHFTFNDQYYRLHGLTAAQAGGYRMHVSEFTSKWVHPDDAQAVAQVIRQGLAATDPGFQLRIEGRLMRADGQPLWVTVWFRPEKDAEGRTVRLHGVNQDIHERKLAEARAADARAELERNLRFTESLLAAIPAPVFFKDAAGRYLGCNRAFTEVMGRTAEEIRGRTVYECWPSEHARVYHQRDLELMCNPELQVYDFKVRNRHGEVRDVIYAKNVFYDEADRVAGIVGAFTDITERKQAEAALRHRQELDRLVAGISTRLISLKAGEVNAGIEEALAELGSFTGVDRSYVFLFRDPPALMDNTHEWCRDGVRPQIEHLQRLPVADFPSVQAVQRGETFHIPRVAALPEGSAERREFEREGIRSLILVPVQSAGRVLGFLGLDSVRTERVWGDEEIDLLRIVGEIFANSVERRRAVAALIEREQRLRFITENMLDIVTQAGPDGTFEYVSPSLQRVLGHDAVELLGKGGLHLVHPDDLDTMGAAVRRALEAGDPSCRVEYRYQHADGHYIWFESTVTILRDAAGAFAGAILASRDISERKAMETQLREAQKLESVGRLAAGVAHDFNNMLTPIMGYAELLQRDLRGMPVSLVKVLEIARAAERSRDLVRQLLAFSRKQVLDLKTVDMREVVAGVEKLLRRTLREDIAIEVKAPAEPCTVRADVGQFEQIIMNLAVNAQDAMPDGGSLLLETASVELDEAFRATHAEVTAGPYVLLCVTDSGQGMDADVRAHLFEPFFTTKERGRGTGLGLATVYGIVKQHGGGICVYSEPGQGATFKIYLPAAGPAAAEVPRRAARTAPARPRRETVLVVEDDGMVRDLVVDVLRQMGCTVLSAGSGQEAEDVAARHEGPIDLLLTDVVIPGLDGRELHARVARLHPPVKVLFMSGYTRNVIAHRGVLDEGVNFIHKPFSVADLQARVSEILDQR